MTHLNDILYRQLVTGAAVSDDFRAHLATPCEECARYLEARTTADAHDGRIDAALLAPLAKIADAPSGELDTILAAVERSRSSRLPWRALAIAALALVAIGFGVMRQPAVGSTTADLGIKGDAPLTVSTALAIVGSDGHVRPGGPGGQVAPSDALSLRLDLSREAHISVVRLDDQGSEIVLQNELAPAGSRDLRRAGQLVGIPMAGLSGEQRVRVVASDRTLTPAEIEAAAKGTAIPGAAVGGLSVRVAP